MEKSFRVLELYTNFDPSECVDKEKRNKGQYLKINTFM